MSGVGDAVRVITGLLGAAGGLYALYGDQRVYYPYGSIPDEIYSSPFYGNWYNTYYNPFLLSVPLWRRPWYRLGRSGGGRRWGWRR